VSGFVALLRGVNVGGKNRVPMAALAKLFTSAGCENVRTFIQSGNVVFDAKPAVFARLPDALERSFATAFGFPTPIVMRSARELAAVVAANPYKGHEDSLHVTFLAARPKPAAIATLDPSRSPGDEFAVVGREIFLHCPNGIGRTKLSNDYFDRKLATTGTVRNWRTVTKLLELTRG
jgi:uncharacterized protein (DUF1697 family)